MEIILCEDYPALGYVGDRISVKGGYARNYLIPRGIATEVRSRNAALLKHNLDIINAKKAKKKKDAEDVAAKLQSESLRFELKIGGHGKSFGSIGAKDAYDALAALGYSLDRRQVRLNETIKSGGQFHVQVQLHSEVVVKVPVIVEAQIVAPATSSAQDGKKRRGKAASALSEDAPSDIESKEVADETDSGNESAEE